MFGNWELALAAYNCGEGCVSRAIAANQKRGLPTDYLSLKLPAETRSYVPKLIAVKNIVLAPNVYGVELESLAESLGISAQIDFLGECADVSFLLQTADIGILPSHEEGMSNVILEAMATALPMIATNVGGNAEAIVNAESGIIVPPRNISMLAEAILFLARDAQSRVRLGKAGRERAVAHFGLEHCADLYDTLYAQLMEGKPISDLGEFIPRLRQ